MIKTVSFAPPRSARAAAKAASAKPANAKPASKKLNQIANAQPARATGVATVASKPTLQSTMTQPAKKQPTRATSGDSKAEATVVAPRRRTAKTPIALDEVLNFEAPHAESPKSEAIIASKVTAAKATRAAQSALSTEAAATDAVPLAAKTPAKRATRKTVGAADAGKAGATEPENLAPEAALAPEVTSLEAVSVPQAVVAPKVKRSRAPKDLALQYGGAAPETDVAPRVVADKPAPRKRLTREAKAARSQMLRPDDDVLQRLQQANAVEVKKPVSRGRGWEFVCGCCGRISRFQTPAAICECGAIAVRE